MRRIIQILTSIGYNSHFLPLFGGPVIYQGILKGVCVPTLNCYGCPATWFGCPIGNFQHFVTLRTIPYYIIGFFLSIGLAVGRMACGWVCPFGFIQDLLYKIKTIKGRLPNWMRYGKYTVLVGVAILVVYFTAEPWFCKICPDGTLIAGIPLILANPGGDLRALVGWHFYMKIAIFVTIILFSIAIKRFFCRVLCPIGALYSLFNRFSILKISVEEKACIDCDTCAAVCPMGVHIKKSTNSIDCIRCLDCVAKCPGRAVKVGI
ncbi:MAG: 4Fe-4S binding protein [candidate division WOR-3 bacterium]